MVAHSFYKNMGDADWKRFEQLLDMSDDEAEEQEGKQDNEDSDAETFSKSCPRPDAVLIQLHWSQKPSL